MKHFCPLKEECEENSLQCIVGRERGNSLCTKPWTLKLHTPWALGWLQRTSPRCSSSSPSSSPRMLCSGQQNPQASTSLWGKTHVYIGHWFLVWHTFPANPWQIHGFFSNDIFSTLGKSPLSMDLLLLVFSIIRYVILFLYVHKVFTMYHK